MADLAFILCNDDKLPKATQVVARAKQLGLALVHDKRKDREQLGFELRGHGAVIVMLMPVPHPDAAAMATGPTSITSDEAAAASRHLIVTALGLEGEVARRDLTMALLAAAVIDNVDAVGAMLGHGVVFHKPALFSEMAAAGVKTGALPPEIAVDITAAQESAKRMSFLTHGMARYGREELYVTCPIKGKGALGFVFDLTRWLLTDRDKQLATGETIGRTAEEKIRIERVPNPTGRGGPVIRLALAR